MIYLQVIIIFSLLGMQALFHPGIYTAHDIWHQVVRFYYYSQGINDGQFPPYWISQLANKFGYPLFIFSYHLPWIIGTVLMKLRLDIFSTLKALFFLSYITSGITMHIFMNNLLKNRLSAMLSSILYLWLPYHFLIIFVGASIGIAFIFAFLPLIFLGMHLVKEKSRYGVPILALGFSGIILSHIMHLIFLAPVILIFFFWEFISTKNRFSFLKNICFGSVLGILISSFYLLPAAYYNQFTRAREETGFSELYKRNFINFDQLIYSKWNFGPIINNAKNGEMPFQLGFAQWISVLVLALLVLFKKLSKTARNLSIYMLSAFTISIFLMLDLSETFWAFLVKFVTVDFPFRLLLPATFIASVSAGIVLINISKKLQGLFLIFLIFIAIYTNRNHLNVNSYTNFPISTYLNLESERTTNTFNEYLPIKADGKLLNKPWNEVTGENLSVSNTKQTTNLFSFNLSVKKEQIASIGQFYFPGQMLYLDDKLTPLHVDKQGRISVSVPQGTHTIKIHYQETLLIKISKYLTIMSILFTLLLLFKRKSYS